MTKQIEKNVVASSHIVAGEEFKNDFTALQEPVFASATKSAEIRKRAAAGQSRSQIAKAMNIRYQHVRNVLTQPLKKAA
jgi:hypothetical protein